VDKIKKIGIGFGIFVASFFILIVISAVTNFEQDKEEQELKSELRNMSIEELHELSVSWYYDDLLRNPEKYKGKIIEFDGEIFRVDSIGKDHYAFYLWTGTGEYGLDQLVVEWKGSRLLDGDEISGYATFVDVVDVGSMLVENYYNPKPHVKAIQITCYNC